MIAAPIRVLLVDDSDLVRAILRDVLQQEPDIIVVGEAANGQEAVAKSLKLQPHLITMDLEMPVMDGMEAITAIMRSKAVPILVVSGVADARKSYEAVRRGALDVVAKPDCNPIALAAFVAKVRMLAGVPVITHIRPLSVSRPQKPVAPAVAPISDSSPENGALAPAAGKSSKVFAIASSTGGPQVLARVLPRLPATFPCPVLIAQHIAEGFAEGMVAWLAGLCLLPVKMAADGEKIKPGVIYIAPPEYTCAVAVSRRFVFSGRQAQGLYHPSCDRLLESLAETYQADAVGIIMTGMGHDGVQGITRIRDLGGVTLAQNAETSLIYGMNRCAVESGAVQKQLPAAEIAPEMLRLAGVSP